MGRSPHDPAAALSSAKRPAASATSRDGQLAPQHVALVLEVGGCLALLSIFVALKLNYNPPLGDSLDGSYYFNIARHVARGHGLVSNLSIFHMGLEPLPQAVVTYPLLPLLMGWLGRAIGVERAAEWLPEALYWLSLVLCYCWLRGAARRSLGGPRWFAPAAAALVTTWFALNPVYHWSSSRPYTESLGFVLVFLTLLAYGKACALSVRRARWPSALVYAAVGVLAGLCYLARFQLLIVVFALAASELWQRRSARFSNSAALVAGAAVPIGLWALRFMQLPHAGLRPLFDYAAYRQLETLPPFRYTYECSSTWDCVKDKWSGVVESLRPDSSLSYAAQFGVAVYLLPLAALALALGVMNGQRLARWRAARRAPLVASVLMGLLAVLPIHLVHARHWNEWAFGWRQGLPLFLSLAPVSLLLLAGFRWRKFPRLGRALAAASALALVVAAVSIAKRTLGMSQSDVSRELLASREAAADYLQRFALHERTLAIEPQPLAVFTDAPLDWLACWSVPELAERLVAERHVTRVVLRPEELRCRSLVKIRERLQLEAIVGDAVEFGVFRVGRP